MGTTHTYEISLTPKDVPLSEASETRSFDLSLDADLGEEDRQAQVTEYIIDEQILDPWAFRKHWEIARIARADPVERLQDALRNCNTQQNPKEDEVPYTLYIHESLNNGHRQLTSLTIPRSLRNEVREFVDTTLDDREDCGVRLYDVHAAMIEAIADIDPAITDQFDTDPERAQFEFIKLALDHQQAVLDIVDS